MTKYCNSEKTHLVQWKYIKTESVLIDYNIYYEEINEEKKERKTALSQMI